MDSTISAATARTLLIKRNRATMFAALRAGVTRAELLEALDVAEAARARELAAEQQGPGRLRLVPAAG